MATPEEMLVGETELAAAASQRFCAATADGSLASMNGDDVAAMARLVSRNPYTIMAQVGADPGKVSASPVRVYGAMMKTYYDTRARASYEANQEDVRRVADEAAERRLARLARVSPSGGRGVMDAVTDLDDSALRKLEESLVFA